jgi:hypothetical protein
MRWRDTETVGSRRRVDLALASDGKGTARTAAAQTTTTARAADFQADLEKRGEHDLNHRRLPLAQPVQGLQIVSRP